MREREIESSLRVYAFCAVVIDEDVVDAICFLLGQSPKTSESFIAGRMRRPWLVCTLQDLTTPSAPGNVRSTRPRGQNPRGVRSLRS